jgi:hypothetical protein
MNWINIETTTLDSEEFVGSEPINRATWLCLFRFCAGQENGGVIVGCKSWADRKWQQLARVTQSEVFAESALWDWVGDDLHLWSYPTDKESEVKQRRERARTNGQRGGRPALVPPLAAVETNVGTQNKPTLVNSGKAEGEREGEGEGEGEGNKTVGQSDCADVSAPASSAKRKRTPKPKLDDGAWLASLAADPTFAGIDVAREHGKCALWCETNRQQLSRRRFVNWLNRCDRPMAGSASQRGQLASDTGMEELKKRFGGTF